MTNENDANKIRLKVMRMENELLHRSATPKLYGTGYNRDMLKKVHAKAKEARLALAQVMYLLECLD